MKLKTTYVYQFITPEGRIYEREFDSHSSADEFSNKKLYGIYTKSHYHKAVVTILNDISHYVRRKRKTSKTL